jgi:hypothetical protein
MNNDVKHKNHQIGTKIEKGEENGLTQLAFGKAV